jgi:hypothetical protein
LPDLELVKIDIGRVEHAVMVAVKASGQAFQVGAATVLGEGVCWFIFKTEPFPPYFTKDFEPRSTYPANFLGRVCRSDQRGNT